MNEWAELKGGEEQNKGAEGGKGGLLASWQTCLRQKSNTAMRKTSRCHKSDFEQSGFLDLFSNFGIPHQDWASNSRFSRFSSSIKAYEDIKGLEFLQLSGCLTLTYIRHLLMCVGVWKGVGQVSAHTHNSPPSLCWPDISWNTWDEICAVHTHTHTAAYTYLNLDNMWSWFGL